MRRIIAALQVSLDGFIEGPNGERDWIDSWEDCFDLLPQIDTCILGAGMYPGYEAYWGAIQAAPDAILQFSGKRATPGEIAYAHFAEKASHVVLSTTLFTTEWKRTAIVRHVEAIAALKRRPGKDIHAVGGARLVASLMNGGLVDELRLVVHPVVLGGGKQLFEGMKQRQALELVGTNRLGDGLVRLTYHTKAQTGFVSDCV